jgi:peptidoglycan-associated lipoprotein
MKLASKKFCLVIIGAALALSGCAKKPARPDPTGTLGQPLNDTAQAPTNLPTTTEPGSILQPRDDFDPSGRNPIALQAQTIYFDFDSSAVKQGEREKLKFVKDYLDKNLGFRLALEGRCDWRGTAEYNLSLGDRRANAVKSFLQSLGVAADKLEASSKGSLDAAKNADDATMAKDRRVDLIVVKAK